MSKKRRISFVVTLDLPEGASVAAAQAYVDEAIAVWRGSLCPGVDSGDGTWIDADPMFDLDPDSVTVKRYRKPSR